MGWFNSNKKEEISEIPKLPTLNNFNYPMQLPEIPPALKDENLPELPPIQPPPLPMLTPLPKAPLNFTNNPSITEKTNSLNEMISAKFVPSNYPPTDENINNLGMRKIGGAIQPMAVEKEYEPEIMISKKTEPVFIRLDKFETTISSFSEIKRKIAQIENLLSKTKEIKLQEEKELEEWERDIQGIKSRIDFIDKNIFNKLD